METLTKEEKQVLSLLLSKAFMLRELFHQVAGLPGTKEYDTERTLQSIRAKLKD